MARRFNLRRHGSVLAVGEMHRLRWPAAEFLARSCSGIRTVPKSGCLCQVSPGGFDATGRAPEGCVSCNSHQGECNSLFNCSSCQASLKCLRWGMVLSEVAKPLIMMSRPDASTHAAECGRSPPADSIEVCASRCKSRSPLLPDDNHASHEALNLGPGLNLRRPKNVVRQERPHLAVDDSTARNVCRSTSGLPRRRNPRPIRRRGGAFAGVGHGQAQGGQGPGRSGEGGR